MAFHPLTLLGAERGRGKVVQLLEKLQEDALNAVSSYFLQRQLYYLTAPVNVQCSGHSNTLEHGQQEVWINDSNDLPIITVWKCYLCGSSECGYLQHQPLPCTEGQKRDQVPPVLQAESNSSNTPEKYLCINGCFCSTALTQFPNQNVAAQFENYYFLTAPS